MEENETHRVECKRLIIVNDCSPAFFIHLVSDTIRLFHGDISYREVIKSVSYGIGQRGVMVVKTC